MIEISRFMCNIHDCTFQFYYLSCKLINNVYSNEFEASFTFDLKSNKYYE